MKILKLAFMVAVLAMKGPIAKAQAVAAEAPRPQEKGWVDFKKPINPDPTLQHAKETYILYGCVYCHGVDLRVRNGEAADLLHSRIVGADTDGSTIAGLLKHGIPQTAKLSPMPQFSDLSQRELNDIARWIHYSRMEGRFGELMRMETSAGDAAAGAKFYQENCVSCHDGSAISTKVKAAKPAEQKALVLKPSFLEKVQSFNFANPDALAKDNAAKAKHQHLLENYEAKDVANLLEYLKR